MANGKHSFIAILAIMVAFSQTAFAAENDQWPRKIEKNGTTVIIYQPQVESLTANKLESRAAVSVTNEEFTSPVYGAMWFDCKIETDKDERTVTLLDVKVSAAKFPDIEGEKIDQLSAFLEKEIPGWDMEMSLDQLLADLDVNETAVNLSENLNNSPPEIIFETAPSVLILVDGDPIFEEIEKTSYERILNTPFFIVRDTKKSIYYINGGEHWYVSEDGLASWEYTTKVPGKLEQIAKEAIGDQEEESADNEENVGETVIPAIIIRTTPAELLQSDGEPEFSPIEGTSILYMTNTADDILMNIDSQEYYVLVAGRWYRSKSLTKGPWSFVDPDKVPAGFADIPTESDMGSVRASIAGTQEAKEAMLENQIPQTAEVDRKEAKLEVTYDGKPKFEPIEKTKMKYAVNTDKSVLLIDNRYYCCDNAIWFEAGSPTGPWMVSTSVPNSVQEIPPESPVYNVKYVYIYDSTPEIVYVGYTPGYVNSYVYGGCVYYGTGYYYRPWHGAYYYPRPVTYGYNVHWNPYSGWGFSFGVSYGWMTVGWGSPYYGWWGPAGYRHGYHYGYHHGYSSGYRAGYYAGQRNSYGRPTTYSNRATASNNIYNNRGQGVARSGNTVYDPRNGNRVSTPDRAARPSTQPANRPNNVYTDRNGNVYQREGNDWNRVDNSGSRPQSGTQPSTRPSQPADRPSQPSTRPTQPADRPSQPSARPSQPSANPSQPSARPSQPSARPGSSPNTNNLNRDYNNRNRGDQRTQQYNQNRQNYQYSRPSSSPSARPSSPSARPSTSPSRSGAARPSGGVRR